MKTIKALILLTLALMLTACQTNSNIEGNLSLNGETSSQILNKEEDTMEDIRRKELELYLEENPKAKGLAKTLSDAYYVDLSEYSIKIGDQFNDSLNDALKDTTYDNAWYLAEESKEFFKIFMENFKTTDNIKDLFVLDKVFRSIYFSNLTYEDDKTSYGNLYEKLQSKPLYKVIEEYQEIQDATEKRKYNMLEMYITYNVLLKDNQYPSNEYIASLIVDHENKEVTLERVDANLRTDLLSLQLTPSFLEELMNVSIDLDNLQAVAFNFGGIPGNAFYDNNDAYYTPSGSAITISAGGIEIGVVLPFADVVKQKLD